MSGDLGPIALAERILGLLEEGSFSATYKYALMMALLDLCFERTSKHGVPPTSLTTRQVALKVIELYWPHATPFEGRGILRQGGVRTGNQAEILRAITAFRAELEGGAAETLHRSQRSNSSRFAKLLSFVEWKLVEMPIPRLQVLGASEERFLYEYGWNQSVRQRELSAPGFDNRLLLAPGVGENLVRLAGVLRPVIQREWAAKVAQLNALPEQRLERFLFGADRTSLLAVREPLAKLQERRCFYCRDRLDSRCEVDHFIPWARYPEDSLDNLVVAHASCNNSKRDFLAAADHVERWRQRQAGCATRLEEVAAVVDWPRAPDKTLSVATALYLRLPEEARLWLCRAKYVPMVRERERIARVLAA